MSAVFGPGSALWLLRHDLRLMGRELRSASKRKRFVLRYVVISVVVLLHLGGLLYAPELAHLHDTARAPALLVASFAIAGAFALFLSKAISESTESLFQRGDLDLLMSSPLPMRRVLISRLAAIALNAGFMPMLLLVPLLNGMMLRGEFAWAGAYVVLVSLSLLAASLGSAVTFGLLAWAGPRWTKLIARTIATLLGAVAFITIQLKVLIPAEFRLAVWQALMPAPGSTPSGPLWWPARAALGDTMPVLALMAAALLAVLGVSAALGRAYGSGVMGNLALPRAAHMDGVARHFRDSPLDALRRKERRLLIRHPGLIAQMFYQMVFLVPGTIALTNIGPNGKQSVAGVVFLTAMMTGRIAKIVAAGPFEGDQAEALAVTSPTHPAHVLRAKVLVTIVALLLIAGLPVVAIGLKLAAAFAAASVASAAAAGARVWLAVRRAPQLRRAGLQGRLQASTDGLLGVGIDIGWGVAGALLTLVL